MGEESLLEAELQEYVESLLSRRGYVIERSSPDYSIDLSYRTVRRDMPVASYLEERSSAIATSARTTSASQGLGVSIATQMAALVVASKSRVSGTIGIVESYTHVLSMTILSSRGDVLWKGESTWDTPMLDATLAFRPALLLLVSHLPKGPENWPEVPRVRPGRNDNYYRSVCEGRWFSSPALPYRVTFGTTYGHNTPRCVKNPDAFAAYIDLLETAEEALPVGLDSYENPLDQMLWSKVWLGSRYHLGSASETVPIIVALSGNLQGYTIKKCWIATEDEYADFRANLDRWQQALAEYYDIYMD